MSVIRLNRIILTGAMLSLAALASGCSSIDRLSQIGEKPRLTEIENPTTQPGYKPVQMPMPKPETGLLQCQLAVAERLARLLQGSARGADRRSPDGDRQHHRQGQHRQRDPAQPLRQGRFGDHRFHRIPDDHAGKQDPARQHPDHGLDVVERRQGLGQPPGSVADQRRRRRDAGAAERQSRGRRQAGDPRQLRNPRTDRRRHRPPRRHPERQHHRFLARSRRPASPMAAAARSPTCSNPATASR